MNCLGCGKCCYLTDPYLDVELTFRDTVPIYMTTERNGLRWMRRNDDGSCIALNQETNLCMIYNDRPHECISFDQTHPLCKELLNVIT